MTGTTFLIGKVNSGIYDLSTAIEDFKSLSSSFTNSACLFYSGDAAIGFTFWAGRLYFTYKF